jgi:ERCC4-type nuclease
MADCMFIDDTVGAPQVPQVPQATHIILDSREHELIRLISSPVKTLHVGDIWVGLSGDTVAHGGLAIERKTWADLEASVMDGRYREQRGRLLAFSQETGARIAYIIEKSKQRKWSPSTVRKFIYRLQFVHGITVIESSGIGSTAEIIREFAAMYKDDPTAFICAGSTQRASEGIHVVKKDNDSNPRLFAMKVLCLCTGVSSTIAEQILVEFGSLERIMEIGAAEIAAVKVNGRRVGPKIGERLHNLLHYK